MNSTDKQAHATQASGFIASLLAGGGVPANWVKIITGALIGAAVALGFFSQTSCTPSSSMSLEQRDFILKSSALAAEILLEGKGGAK